jgi:hypothetical protein
MSQSDSQLERSSGASPGTRSAPPEHPLLSAFRLTAAVAVSAGALYAGAPWQALIAVAIAIALPAQAGGIIRRALGSPDRD